MKQATRIKSILSAVILLAGAVTLGNQVSIAKNYSTPLPPGIQSAPIPPEVVTWKISGKSGNVQAQNTYKNNTGYNLFCQSNGRFLTYAKQSVGINLDFTSDPEIKKIHFILPDHKEREVLTGEPVAFGIGGGEAFLRYAERTAGINLEWSTNPAYEWVIYGASGEKGRPIATEASISIGNVNVRPEPDFFIYFNRPGADVGWTSSPDWYNKLSAGAKTALKSAKRYLHF
jgi:hypothetical protein